MPTLFFSCFFFSFHKQKGFDVFCALDVMDNMSFLEKLKFTISDKSVHYYLYNWKCPLMSPDKVLTTVMSPLAKRNFCLSGPVMTFHPFHF